MNCFSGRLFIVLILLLSQTSLAKVFLNTTDASDKSDELIKQRNIDLPAKYKQIILQQNALDSADKVNKIEDTVEVKQVILSEPFVKQPGQFSLYLGHSKELITYNLGVLEAIEEHHFPIKSIGGSGWGSVIATLWAAGYSSKEISNLELWNEQEAELDSSSMKTLGVHQSWQLTLDQENPEFTPYKLQLKVANPTQYKLSQLFAKLEEDIKLGYDSLRVPLFIIVSDLESFKVKLLDQNNLLQNLSTSLTSVSDSIMVGAKYVSPTWFESQAPAMISQQFQAKVIQTEFVPQDAETLTTQYQLISQGLNPDSLKTNLKLRSFEATTESTPYERGYIDFANRLSSIYRMAPDLMTKWVEHDQLFQENIIFKGLDLSDIPASHHSHIQSFFPLLKEDRSDFKTINQAILQLLQTRIYKDLKALYVYDSVQRAYRLKLTGDIVTKSDFGLGFYGNHQVGMGLAGYFQQTWVSQFYVQLHTQGVFTQSLQSIAAQLRTHLGTQGEWQLQADISAEDWDFTDMGQNSSNVDILKTRQLVSEFIVNHPRSSEVTLFGGFNFSNQSFMNENTINLKSSNPFQTSSFLLYNGLEIITGIEWGSLNLAIRSGTRAVAQISEATKPLLIQPHLTIEHPFSIEKLQITPKLQGFTSNQYQSLLRQEWEFRPSFIGFGGRVLDPISDSLMRARIDVGELSQLFWDTRYYADQYIALEFPIKYQWRDFSVNATPLMVLLYDQPGFSPTREWYALESFLQYEYSHNFMQLGVEQSHYRKWRDGESEPKWLARIGLRGF